MSALKYWVWLTTRKGLSGPCRHALLEHFGSPEEIYYAEPVDLRQVEGITADQLRDLENKSLDSALAILEECARKDIFLLTMQDALYPQRLKNIYDPPLLLYGKGAMPLFDEEAAVAVVGTRRCTPYGIRTAERFGFEMSKQGGLVVSGLARGIDAAAQGGALRAGALTAAVLGCGVDVVYPMENSRLYEDVASSGVLLAEYPPGTEPNGWHFPARNRILSGLCLATLVVEAPEKSGALITAATALEQCTPSPANWMPRAAWAATASFGTAQALLRRAGTFSGNITAAIPINCTRTERSCRRCPSGATFSIPSGRISPRRPPRAFRSSMSGAMPRP